MSIEEFLGGVRVLQPSAENLRDPPPPWMFLTPSLSKVNADFALMHWNMLIFLKLQDVCWLCFGNVKCADFHLVAGCVLTFL